MKGPASRNIFVEVFRETFPKNLRFDKPSQILYAQCYSISKRYKHKKYIPRGEIEDVLNQHTRMPCRPWLQLPVVRQLCLVRFVNWGRTLAGGKSWLFTRGVEAEYGRIESWLEEQGRAVAAKSPPRRRSSYASSTSGAKGSSSTTSASAAAATRIANMVERERFDKEVLGQFHVATMYQRMVRAGLGAVLLLLFLAFASVNTDHVVYLWCRFWWRMDGPAIMAWMRSVTQRHTTADIPEAYASLLPPPCFTYTNAAGAVCYGVNIAEFASEERNISVICIPCPQAGEKAFYEQVGQVAAISDAVVVEGVRFEDIDRIPPAGMLPLKDNTFPALGVHHRFLDILRSGSSEPPMLFPGGSSLGWRAWLQQVLVPFELRCVYNPTGLSATRGEARVGWGRLRDVIDMQAAERQAALATESRGKNQQPPPPYVIAVPWTVNQVVNLEASLIKHGFRLRNVFPLHWIEEDHMGRSFCEFFDIAHPQ